MRYLVIVTMPDAKTVKFQVYLSEDLRTRFKAKCVMSGTTMNETAVSLIEAWTDKDELPASNGKPAQSQPEPTNAKESDATPPPRDRSKPRVMSLAELFALKTLSSLIQENYYKLQESGKIGHQRLKKLASGERASQQERQIIAQVLGLEESGLPED